MAGERDVLSLFWAPLCAVGARGPRGPNAQICVSVFGASILPERPRLLVSLSKTNYTEGLARANGRLTVSVLGAEQAGLLAPLGLRSGRDGDKLAGLAHETTSWGAPLFPGGAGELECETLDAFDLGDATAFLVAVRERRAGGAEPLTWAAAREVVGDDFLERWAEKSAREQEAARAVMRWRERGAGGAALAPNAGRR